MRLKAVISYRGTDFQGWQVQPGYRTVQGVLEQHLQKLTGVRTPVTASGRTDAGVHAMAQVCHFDFPERLAHFLDKPSVRDASVPRLHHSLNGMLPDDVSIVSVERAKDTFHAIRDAKRKTYVYYIHMGAIRPVIMAKFSWHMELPLDLKAMKRAATFMKGEHDFKSFCGANATTKTSVRTIKSIAVKKGVVSWPGLNGAELDSFVTVTVTANGFLKNMVRNLVGTLVGVGRHQIKPDDVKRIIKARDRREAGVTAPAQGLFLAKVVY